MSQFVEPTAVTASAAMGNPPCAVDSSSRVCRVDGTELEDSYAPSFNSQLPSPAQMRAFRSQSVNGLRPVQRGLGDVRFHLSVRDSMMAKSIGGQSLQDPESSHRASAVAEASTGTAAMGFCTDLWYAQSATQELHVKSAQLSFGAIKTRI